MDKIGSPGFDSHINFIAVKFIQTWVYKTLYKIKQYRRLTDRTCRLKIQHTKLHIFAASTKKPRNPITIYLNIDGNVLLTFNSQQNVNAVQRLSYNHKQRGEPRISHLHRHRYPTTLHVYLQPEVDFKLSKGMASVVTTRSGDN